MAISKLDLPAGVLAHSLAGPAHLATALAQRVADALRAALDSHGQATLVVSGGRSPIAFFTALAQQELAWAQVTVSLADERWVPVGHADSNERLVRAHLLQGRAAKARFVGLYQAHASLEGAAQKAEAALAALPPIDVLVLGMGDDGHTASLFPGNPLLADALSPQCSHGCLPMHAPSSPHQRLSLTLPRLAAARTQLLAIQGPGKLTTLTQALAGDDPLQLPIRAFLHAPLEIYWCP
jgi:6-phosphogluconolactonase